MNNKEVFHYEQALEDIQRVYYELNLIPDYETFYQKVMFAKEERKLSNKLVLLLAITLLRDAVARDNDD